MIVDLGLIYYHHKYNYHNKNIVTNTVGKNDDGLRFITVGGVVFTEYARIWAHFNVNKLQILCLFDYEEVGPST